MSSQDARNHSLLIPPLAPLSRGHLALVTRRLSLAQLADVEMREIAAGCKRVAVANSTAYPCPAVAEIAQGTRFPIRVITKIIMSNLVGGGSYEFGERIGELVLTINAFAADEQGRTPTPPRGAPTLVTEAFESDDEITARRQRERAKQAEISGGVTPVTPITPRGHRDHKRAA